MKTYQTIVIGGGFFGAEVAISQIKGGGDVLLVEKESELLKHASYANQARVHQGYHYPRSVLTAIRSRVSFPRFTDDYSEAIVDTFDQYYAVAKNFSKVSARQFERFCERVGADTAPAPDTVQDLFDSSLVEAVYTVTEAAFDADALRRIVTRRLEAAGVEVQASTTAVRLTNAGGRIGVTLDHNGVRETAEAERVYNCTYSQINQLHAASELPLVPLKHEIAEVALITPPAELTDLGVTVMCGPFFSTMPFPAKKMHSLTHVRYTPHYEWHDTDAAHYRDPHEFLATHQFRSAYPKMLADAKRYLPPLARAEYQESLWEVKTVLPQSEGNDSRPILFRTYPELPGYACIMGGKIDNIYDVLTELEPTHAAA